MKALVVYDSIYGNTEQIAQAIGDTLKTHADVQVLRAGDVLRKHLAGLGLLVVGAPTHGGHPSAAASTWLKSLAPNSLRGVKFAAFDTRVPVSAINSRFLRAFAKVFGFAAPRIAGSLTKLGGIVVMPAEGFYVKDTEGPLVEGELERASAWAQQILGKV